MKRIILVLLFIVVFSIPVFAQAQYNFFGIGVVGLSEGTLNYLSGNEALFFQSALWGVNVRLKLSKIFGFAFDVFYIGKQFYFYDQFNNTWYGPSPWDILIFDLQQNQVDTSGWVLEEDSWQYYHHEFYLNADVGFYLPIFFIQIYFEFGPSFFLVKKNEALEQDNNFMNYYVGLYGSGGFAVGLNFKLGLDLFLGKGISLGAFLYFIEPSIENFFTNMQNNPQQYIMENGHIGLELMFWL